MCNDAFEHFADPLQAAHKGVHIFWPIVDIETCAGGPRNPALSHERLAAMVSGTNRNSLLVQDCPDVMGMHCIDVKRDNRAATLQIPAPVE